MVCDAGMYGTQYTLDDVIAGNVEKLKKRYPGGEFDVYKSENRLEDDL